jgi:hypothetical protein
MWWRLFLEWLSEAGSEADLLQAPRLSAPEEVLTPGCRRCCLSCGRGSTQSRRQYKAGCTQHLQREWCQLWGRCYLLTGSRMRVKPALKPAAVALFQRAGKSIVHLSNPIVQPSKHNLDFRAVDYLYYIVHAHYIFFYAFETLRNS